MKVTASIPAPLEHQEEADQHPARFKVLRCGRRWGKDRLAFKAAMTGHGPLDPHGTPLWRGVAQGRDIAWIARDYSQAKGIWLEEFVPRFKPLPHVHTDEQELHVRFGGVHARGVHLYSDKNINSVRGLGKNLGGVILNEGAWFDLESAWLSVIRPILADNRGWAIFMSTTNSGADGNRTGLTPSYFNRLCGEIREGVRDIDWAEFTGTGWDNPSLPDGEMDALAREYDQGGMQYREEILAELVPAGAGLAFPMWSRDQHLRAMTIPPHWPAVCGMDWGIFSPSVIHYLRLGPDRQVVYAREWTWTDKDAYEAGWDFASALLMDDALPVWPDRLWCDEAMNERTGVEGRTIIGEFQRGIDDALHQVRGRTLPCIPAPKGPGSRASRFNLMTGLLRWGPALDDGTLPLDRRARMLILTDAQGRATCPLLAKDLATLPRHPKSRDDVDDSKGGGHAYDAASYPLMGEWARAVAPVSDVPQDQHPGFLPTGRRRSRHRTDPEVQREEAEIMYAFTAEQHEVRPHYGRRPGR